MAFSYSLAEWFLLSGLLSRPIHLSFDSDALQMHKVWSAGVSYCGNNLLEAGTPALGSSHPTTKASCQVLPGGLVKIPHILRTYFLDILLPLCHIQLILKQVLITILSKFLANCLKAYSSLLARQFIITGTFIFSNSALSGPPAYE